MNHRDSIGDVDSHGTTGRVRDSPSPSAAASASSAAPGVDPGGALRYLFALLPQLDDDDHCRGGRGGGGGGAEGGRAVLLPAAAAAASALASPVSSPAPPLRRIREFSKLFNNELVDLFSLDGARCKIAYQVG